MVMSVSTAALSSAVPEPLAERGLDAWQRALTELAGEWAARLEDLDN